MRLGAHASASERASDRERRALGLRFGRPRDLSVSLDVAASFPNGRRPPKIQQAGLESRPIKPPADEARQPGEECGRAGRHIKPTNAIKGLLETGGVD